MIPKIFKASDMMIKKNLKYSIFQSRLSEKNFFYLQFWSWWSLNFVSKMSTISALKVLKKILYGHTILGPIFRTPIKFPHLILKIFKILEKISEKIKNCVLVVLETIFFENVDDVGLDGPCKKVSQISFFIVFIVLKKLKNGP